MRLSNPANLTVHKQGGWELRRIVARDEPEIRRECTSLQEVQALAGDLLMRKRVERRGQMEVRT